MIAALAGAPSALADGCGIPDTAPVWVDFAGHDAPIPAKPGLVLAVASGTDTPQQMREQGAATVLFDLNFNKRVGTTANPADPSLIEARAKTLYDYAVGVTGCQTPMIAENELFGAQTPTPWSATNAQYRANVLAFLTALSSLGARPLLSIANPPFTGGDAAEWWRQVSKVAILLRQVYFTSPNAKGLSALGPAAASRTMRQSLRGLVNKLTQIGIPSGRVALADAVQLVAGPRRPRRAPAGLGLVRDREARGARGEGGRRRSSRSPASGRGAGRRSTRTRRPIPTSPRPRACGSGRATRVSATARRAAGDGFDASLTDGQVDLPAGARCVLPDGTIDRTRRQPARRRSTGDPGYATSVLFEQSVLKAEQPVDPKDVAVGASARFVAASFGGDRASYCAALAAGAS